MCVRAYPRGWILKHINTPDIYWCSSSPPSFARIVPLALVCTKNQFLLEMTFQAGCNMTILITRLHFPTLGMVAKTTDVCGPLLKMNRAKKTKQTTITIPTKVKYTQVNSGTKSEIFISSLYLHSLSRICAEPNHRRGSTSVGPTCLNFAPEQNQTRIPQTCRQLRCKHV